MGTKEVENEISKTEIIRKEDEIIEWFAENGAQLHLHPERFINDGTMTICGVELNHCEFDDDNKFCCPENSIVFYAAPACFSQLPNNCQLFGYELAVKLRQPSLYEVIVIRFYRFN